MDAAWLIGKLDPVRARFGEGEYPLAAAEKSQFDTFLAILREDEVSLGRKSRATRDRVKRVRSISADVFHGLGPEVFVLCTLGVVPTKLVTIQDGLLPKLKEWWDGVSHPAGLSELARTLCGTLVSSLLSAVRKRKFQTDPEITDEHVSRRQRVISQVPTNQDDIEIVPHSDAVKVFQDGSSQSTGQQSSPSDITLSTKSGLESAALTAEPSIEIGNTSWPEESILPLTFSDLLNFLQQHEPAQPDLRMICPYFGVPSPYVKINLDPAGKSAIKIEFSLELGKALIEHVRKNDGKTGL